MTRADKHVIVLAVALVVVLYALLWRGGGAGQTVEIAVQGQVVQRLSLFEDQVRHIDGLLGESVIEIHDGRVHFTKSPCPNKLCIRTGWLEQSGEMAACLPNGVTVYLQGATERFDSMNF